MTHTDHKECLQDLIDNTLVPDAEKYVKEFQKLISEIKIETPEELNAYVKKFDKAYSHLNKIRGKVNTISNLLANMK